jgi:hypothetical protein
VRRFTATQPEPLPPPPRPRLAVPCAMAAGGSGWAQAGDDVVVVPEEGLEPAVAPLYSSRS